MDCSFKKQKLRVFIRWKTHAAALNICEKHNVDKIKAVAETEKKIREENETTLKKVTDKSHSERIITMKNMERFFSEEKKRLSEKYDEQLACSIEVERKKMHSIMSLERDK